jgi:hypothetical protein
VGRVCDTLWAGAVGVVGGVDQTERRKWKEEKAKRRRFDEAHRKAS